VTAPECPKGCGVMHRRGFPHRQGRRPPGSVCMLICRRCGWHAYLDAEGLPVWLAEPKIVVVRDPVLGDRTVDVAPSWHAEIERRELLMDQLRASFAAYRGTRGVRAVERRLKLFRRLVDRRRATCAA